VSVHRLVLSAFVGDCPPGMVGCHNDGDKSNNRVSNLRWGTPKENARDMIAHGTAPIGSKNGGSIFTEQDIPIICALYDAGQNTCQIADDFGVNVSTIQRILSGERWSHVSRPGRSNA
jgi:hypothetical protein